MLSIEVRVSPWLQQLPQILAAKPQFREQLQKAVGSKGVDVARSEAPQRTGALRRTIGYDITPSGIGLDEFNVRIYCSSPYAHMVHYGTKAHRIPKKGTRPMITPYGIKRRVQHPGARRNPFMFRARQRMIRDAFDLSIRHIDAWLNL